MLKTASVSSYEAIGVAGGGGGVGLVAGSSGGSGSSSPSVVAASPSPSFTVVESNGTYPIVAIAAEGYNEGSQRNSSPFLTTSASKPISNNEWSLGDAFG